MYFIQFVGTVWNVCCHLCNWSDLLIQYICIFQYISVYFRSCPVHSLQVMMSTNLIYFIILCFGVILVVKCLFAMSNVKGWERNTAFSKVNLLYCFYTDIVLNYFPRIESLFTLFLKWYMLDVILFCRGQTARYLLPIWCLLTALVPLYLIIYLFHLSVPNGYCLIHALAALVQAGCGGKIALLGSSVEV